MHRCSIKVDRDKDRADVLPPSLLENHTAICDLLSHVASCIGLEPEATGLMQVRTATTVRYFAPMQTISWMVYLSCPDEGWFQLDICSEDQVDKQRVLDVVKRDFVQQANALAN